MACVVREDPELQPSLPLAPKCRDYRCVTPYSVYLVLGQNGGPRACSRQHSTSGIFSIPFAPLSIQAPVRLD